MGSLGLNTHHPNKEPAMPTTSPLDRLRANRLGVAIGALPAGAAVDPATYAVPSEGTPWTIDAARGRAAALERMTWAQVTTCCDALAYLRRQTIGHTPTHTHDDVSAALPAITSADGGPLAHHEAWLSGVWLIALAVQAS